jgi:hypothetical protein
MINTEESSSFRDPDAFVFYKGNDVYRQINHSYKKTYDKLLSSGLYSQLTKKHLLLPHTETDISNAFSPCDAYKVITHPKIPFISYPYEWCFSQLKDAALTMLTIQKHALHHGLILKDASAYNIQFYEGKFQLIDTGSFECYEEGTPWTAYQQFCRHFLAPLALMSYRDIRLNQLLRLYIDGIPLDIASTLLPFSSLLSFPILAHIFLHSRSIGHFASTSEKVGKSISKIAMLGLIDNLESGIRKLSLKKQKTEWSNYYSKTNYTNEATVSKTGLIKTYLDTIKPQTLWDIGANTGRYSTIAAAHNSFTVAFDKDPLAIEQSYLQARQGTYAAFFPLVMDFSNPSPDQGWAHEERQSLESRGKADLLMAVALIHHITMSNNIPFKQIASYFSRLCTHLIIEFIPKSDSQVKCLLANRKDIFDNYTKENFETDFGTHFRIIRSDSVTESERILYLMKKIDD